ncbi:MAG: hypothetical protein U5K54_00210 [Cytophagales bacterium]|nr:hypothetical protein [Cytophagales bacterium]
MLKFDEKTDQIAEILANPTYSDCLISTGLIVLFLFYEATELVKNQPDLTNTVTIYQS